jgi:hypothetical protein
MSNLQNINPDHRPAHSKRPFPVKLLIWVFSFWSLLGWLRFIRTVMERELVFEVLSNGIFVYLIIAGLILGLASLPVIWGLLRGFTWVRTLTWIAAALFPALYWFERETLWRDLTSQGNGLFMVLLTLFWFGLVFWALQSKPGREYFSAPHKGNK